MRRLDNSGFKIYKLWKDATNNEKLMLLRMMVPAPSCYPGDGDGKINDRYEKFEGYSKASTKFLQTG